MTKITEHDLIEKAFKQCFDPELNIDIWTLGLIYHSKIEDGKVLITMTFTSPFCPYGPQLVEELTEKIKSLGVQEVQIEITFDPLWQPSEELKVALGM